MKRWTPFEWIFSAAVLIFWGFVIAICASAMAGCSRQALPAASHSSESSHVEWRDSTERRDRVRYDSIYIHDSVAVVTRADTVFLTRIQWRDRFLTQRDTVAIRTFVAVHDTLIRRDSIPYAVEVVRTVKHVPTLYRWSLWACIGLLALWLWRSGTGGKIWRWVIGLVV